MDAFIRETALAAPFEGSNVDTDQIIPARFLKVDRTVGYGSFLFHDLKFESDGTERPDFVLNQQPFRHARILVTDENFGCGSSREGAVYALSDYGIKALIGPSFGDIFYNNCLKNGLIPVRLPHDVVAGLREDLLRGPDREISIDLDSQVVTLPDGTLHNLEIDPFWRECIMKGVDEVELTLGYLPEIESFEARYLDEMKWINR
ncbi:3-isopropylmalate dehydratase small subunit [Microvirga antarctica]|uniref:3-isopropylmalate dehydratase small subunit n=1 Tax=Microvirga antarctica TaxID=2819233 RepID=UPI001B30DD92|nr:3-isopropylmalate dehydratase small subunit [Microvirga antarctica]